LSILFNSTINSFKRLVPRYEAPIYICWAPKNRSALVRVPDFNNNRAARAELRCPDALCNPYLAFAGLLHAGLEGIQTRASIPQPVKKNLYKLSSTEIRDYGIQTLPGSLQEALTTFSDSLWIAEVFNPRLLTELKVLKRKEIDQYNHSITTWEWQQYKNC
jgi:glutamine synthetase